MDDIQQGGSMPDDALIDILRSTDRTYSAISDIAETIGKLPQADLIELMQLLVAEGEDKATGILLNAIAFLKTQVDPYALCQTLKVVHDIDDFTHPFSSQDEKAIDPLLELAFAQDISRERNVLAVALAAELAIKFATKQPEVKKVLKKLQNKFLFPEMRIYSQAALDCLENESFQDAVIPQLLERDIHQELPKEKPPRYIAQDHTVRRPVPKIGRNDPCHCGSGKKYKKCCLQKDQELFYDASPYAGLTRSQVMASPGLVEGTDIINEMRSYQVKKLNPAELKDDQLFAAYRQADLYGLQDVALNMLLELKDRPEKHDFAVDHMRDLMFAALEAGNLELFRKIEEYVPEDELYDEHMRQFYLSMWENKDLLMIIEQQSQRALTDTNMMLGNNLVDVAYAFDKTYPALSIIFARAAMVERPTSFLDNEMLTEMIRNARTDLDLDTYADPIEDYLEWAMDKHDQDNELEEKEKEIAELKQKISEGRRVAVHKDRELREKEQELKALSKKLEEGGGPGPAVSVQSEQTGRQSRNQENAARLKRRIEQLKMEIREQQQERRRLHQELESKEREETKGSLAEKKEQESHPNLGHEQDHEHFPAPKRVHIPFYTEQFKKSCQYIAPGIVAKALQAATGFATHDTQTLRQSKRLEKLPSVYRIRVGINYRLMLRWKKGEELEVLDLIPREELDKWISSKANWV